MNFHYQVITDCIDPVVVITKNTALGVSVVEEVEMMVVIDRGSTLLPLRNDYQHNIH